MRKGVIIIQGVNCPRCNALAFFRAEAISGGLYKAYTVCNKCKYRKYSGVFSYESICIQKAICVLESHMANESDLAKRETLHAKIEMLRKRAKEKELGL